MPLIQRKKRALVDLPKPQQGDLLLPASKVRARVAMLLAVIGMLVMWGEVPSKMEDQIGFVCAWMLLPFMLIVGFRAYAGPEKSGLLVTPKGLYLPTLLTSQARFIGWVEVAALQKHQKNPWMLKAILKDGKKQFISIIFIGNAEKIFPVVKEYKDSL